MFVVVTTLLLPVTDLAIGSLHLFALIRLKGLVMSKVMMNEKGVSQTIAWDPSAYVGMSDDHIALIKKGFDFALNQVFSLEQAQAKAGASLVDQLKAVEGSVSVHEGVLHLEDGTLIDLGKIATPDSAPEAKASRILISVRGGCVQEVISDAAARVYVLDQDTNGCDMLAVVDGKGVDIQQPDVVIEPERLARMWRQATDGEMVSVNDLDDVEFEVSAELDMSGKASHEGPFYTAAFSISRNEPDASNADRRAACTLTTEIVASDGRSYKAEEEISVGDNGIRSELDEIVSDLYSQEALGDYLDDKIRAMNFGKKPSSRSIGM